MNTLGDYLLPQLKKHVHSVQAVGTATHFVLEDGSMVTLLWNGRSETPKPRRVVRRTADGRFKAKPTILYFDYRGAKDWAYRTRTVKLLSESSHYYYGIDLENGGGFRAFMKSRIRPNGFTSYKQWLD